MKQNMQWAFLYPCAQDPLFFDISCGINDIRKMRTNENDKYTGTPAHWSRRFEYPWAILSLIENGTINKGEKCLDAGGGTALFQFYLTTFYNSVYNVDIQEEPEEQYVKMKQFIKKHGLSIKLVKGSIVKLDYDDEYFDDVFCVSVLEHFSNKNDIIKSIKELLRVTKKRLIVTMDVVFEDIDVSHLTIVDTSTREKDAILLKQAKEIIKKLNIPYVEPPSDVLTYLWPNRGLLGVICLFFDKRE